MISLGKLDPGILRFLLAGNTAMDLEKPMPATPDNWLTEKIWGDLLAMQHIGPFKGFIDKYFLGALDKWQHIYDSKTPGEDIDQLLLDAKYAEDAPPGDDAEHAAFTPFERLCILRCVRPDMIVPRVTLFVAEEMGKRYIEPPPFDLMACYNDSNCATPLIFVLTPGADPMSGLLKCADELGFGGKRMVAISLGQGQGPIAEAAINEAQDKGTWTCLQNCHLCVRGCPCSSASARAHADRVHANSRLWLTSEPSTAFPRSFSRTASR